MVNLSLFKYFDYIIYITLNENKKNKLSTFLLRGLKRPFEPAQG